MKMLGIMLAVSWVLSYLTGWVLEAVSPPWYILFILVTAQAFLVGRYFAHLDRLAKKPVKFHGYLSCSLCGTPLHTGQDLVEHRCSRSVGG